MKHIELPVGAFIAATLVLVPLPWHWRARNVSTLSIIVWLFISNIVYGINAIIWANNVAIVVPVWCDITTKLQIGATMALPACCLCLCIHLERIASARQTNTSHKDKRRRMLFDCLMCWGIPMVYMALHYIVQGHRFDIVENLGCRPAIYTSIESVFIIWVPPLLVVLATLFFAGLALRHFLQRRITFARHLRDSNSALTASIYFRLISMSIVQMFWGSLVIAVNVWFTCRPGLRPWISWEDVHFNFSRIGIFPEVILPQSTLRPTYFSWWTIPASSLLFFIFFAFGQDAMKEYKSYLHCIRRIISRNKGSELKISTASNSITKHLNISTKLSSVSGEYDCKSFSDFKPSRSKKPLSDGSLSIYSPPSAEGSSSFSPSASTHVGGEYELGTYTTKHLDYTSNVLDIEKSAELASPAFSNAETETIYALNSNGSQSHPPLYHIRPQVDAYALDSVDEFIFVPSPASPVSGATSFAQQQNTPLTESARPSSLSFSLHLSAPSPPLALTSLSVPEPTLHQAKQKTSNSSMRTILSPDRDRFYISLPRKLSAESMSFPTTPPPFVNAAMATPSAEAEIAGCRRHIIQVMVHKTETTETEPL